MTHIGREQEVPALAPPPVRTPGAVLAVRAALVALAAAVLFFCYWRQSQAVPLSSDGSSNVLQAWAMLHGNLLLHNWWVSDVSFYTTELPQYMVIEALAGLGPWVVHAAAAMTYTLLVLLAALLARGANPPRPPREGIAKGRVQGGAGWARALLAAGLMLSPQLGATSILLLSPDHTGTAVPLLVIVLAALEAPAARRALNGRLSTGVAVLAAVAAVAVIPGTRTSTNDIDQALPRVVATLAARAPGQMIVLRIDRPAWVETTGFLVQAERSGVRACLDDPWFTFMMTRQFICTPAQAASGRAYWFYTRGGLPPHAQVLLRFSGVAVVPSSP